MGESIVHELACALDDELDAAVYTQRDSNNHVDLVDGQLDTPGLATELIANMRKRGWAFTHARNYD